MDEFLNVSSNNSMDTSTPLASSSKTSIYLFITWLTILVFLCLIAVLGNSVIVVAFIRFKETRKTQTLLLLGQALADIILAVGVIATISGGLFLSVLGVKGLTKGYCFSISVGTVFGRPWSIMMMFCLALERFLAAKFPLWYRKLPETRFFWVCTPLTCVYCMICTTVAFIGLRANEIPKTCNALNSAGGSNGTVSFYLTLLNAMMQLLAFAVPILYFTSLVLMKKRLKNLETNSQLQEMLKEMFEQEKKTHRTMIVIMLFFVAGVLGPTVSVAVFMRMGLLGTWPVAMFVHTGTAINAGCNFFVYLQTNKELRESFIKLYKSCRGTKTNSVAAIELDNHQGRGVH